MTHAAAAGGPVEETARWLPAGELQRLVDALRERGYRVEAPIAREGALQWSELSDVAALPTGLRDEQAPGRYRLVETGSARRFDVVNGPGSVKRFAFAPREPLLQIEMEGTGGGFRATPTLPAPPPTALLGVRACDLAAVAIQDRVFLHDRVPDPHYAARRRGLFLVAVGCTRAADTCFCASLGTGPAPRDGYDLALTELDRGYLVRAGSEAGAAVLAALALGPADAAALAGERDGFAACAASQRRSLPRDPRSLLYENLAHPRWNEVAARCLSCATCSLVCPTCFCSDVQEEPALDGRASERVRVWDSCFDPDHGQVHGINFRPHIRERYRQWLVHKTATWIDQFGSSGCVGCGRCITWCPVGIDLTEEVAAIAATPGARA